MADYNSSFTAQQIENILKGAVVHNQTQLLTEAQKAQARKNIGAGSSDNGLVILGYFPTLEALQTSVINPSAGAAYGVGTEHPYNIYIWDGLHSVWVNNGHIQGANGADGKDASVTVSNINSALGYVPGMVNPNLLDNWHFGNPVNQRGETAYSGLSAGQYSIDRWKVGGVNVTITDGSIIVSGGNNSAFIQDMEIRPSGKLTLSVLLNSIGTGTTRVCVRFTDGSTLQSNPLVAGLNVLAISTAKTINRVFLLTNTANSYTLKAIKLEMGSQQTLAHLENGAWVLNEIPDYGEQLARCQRYFQRYNVAVINKALGLAVARSATQAALTFNFSQPMRTHPTMRCTATFKLLGNVTKAELTPVVEPAFCNMARLNFSTSGLTASAVYFAAADGTGFIDFSADL